MATELKELTMDELEAIVASAVRDAKDFVDSEIAPERVLSQRYFDGAVDIGAEPGRSSVVSTKVRDTIRAIKPSLMRVFSQTDKAVEFVPRQNEDVAMAEQSTNYVNYIFQKAGGFQLFQDAFHDALVKKVGILKVYYEDSDEQTIHEYTGLDQQAFDFLESQPDTTLLSQETEMGMEIGIDGVEAEAPIISARFARKKRNGEIKISSVPPEELYVSRSARSLEDSYVVAHCTEMRVGDLVALGYSYEDVADLTSLSDTTSARELESSTRTGYSTSSDGEDGGQDPSMKLIAVTEAFMRVDTFGTGIPSLYRFVLGGTNYKLLSADPIDHIPFAVFAVDPEPHTFFGRSVCDLIRDDQDAATSILRGILDNVAMTNTPRLSILENAVNLDDVLNNEIGAVIRTRQPGAIQDITVPFAAGQTLPALQYMDQMIEQKTGVTRASQGLHPDALQSTTASAVQATIQAAAGQVETMARNLAEGGMTQLFKLILHLVITHQDRETVMRLENKFIPVDPRTWHADLDVTVNVGLGTGREEERAMALQQALQIQTQILQTYGPGNPLVSMTQFRNTMADLLAAAGIRNSDRYFQPLTPEIEQQLMQQQQAAAAQQPQQADPTQAIMQVEAMKAQQKGQTDMAKLQLEAQKFQAQQSMRQTELEMQDDRSRDEMVQDLAVKVAEILGKYGTAVDVANIKADQAAPRDTSGYFS